MSATVRAVVHHDLDHVAEAAERVLRAYGPGTAERGTHVERLAANVSDAADALAYVADLAPALTPAELGTLTRAARLLGRVLATIDPER